MSKKTKIHFIVGIGRSGTTLLTSIFNQHPNILAAPETFFMLFFAHGLSKKKVWSDDDIELVLIFNKAFYTIQPIIGWSYNEEKLREELQLNRESDYIKKCEIIYRNMSIDGKSDADIEHIIDKNPSYTLQTFRLKKMIPDAKFFCMVRDYRANLLSRKQSVNNRTPNTILNSIRWNIFNKKLVRFINRHPESCYILRYADLVEEPKQKIEEICSFIGLEPSGNMQKFFLKEAEKLDDPEYKELSVQSELMTKKYTDLAQPINTSRIEAWKSELSEKDQKITEIICGKTGSYFGFNAEYEIKRRRLKKILIYLKNPFYVLAAYYDIYKDYLIYFYPLKGKLKRFEAVVNNRLKQFQDSMKE